MPELWEELLYFLQKNVPKGKVTTYGNLSTVVFGGTGSAPAIVAMLNGAETRNPDNCRWTNRVVNAQGGIQVDGQLEQLQREGVPISSTGRVNLNQCPPLGWSYDKDDGQGDDDVNDDGHNDDEDASSAFVVFQGIIEADIPGTEELVEILGNIPYEKGSFANEIINHLEERLQILLDQDNTDLFTLLQLSQKANLLPDNAIDLAHTIRKQRNQIIHNIVPADTYHVRNCLVLIAAFLLWPQLPA